MRFTQLSCAKCPIRIVPILAILVGGTAESLDAMGVKVTIYPLRTVTCTLESIQASFTAEGSEYRMGGQCRLEEDFGDRVAVTPIPWTSKGKYRVASREVKERLLAGGPPPYRGSIDTSLFCYEDPWLISHGGPTACGGAQFTTQPQDNPENFGYLSGFLADGFHRTHLPNTTGFPYDRSSLIAQREQDLRAEAVAKAQAEADAKAAALARTNKKLQFGAQRGPAVVFPIIQSPSPGALFLSNNSIPIKIAPPQGIEATGYFVKVESRNAQGIWTTYVNNLPVSAAEASSPSGYLGWGAPGPGRGAAMIAGPGTYRVSAQVSAPRPTAWSQPVEFVVTAPSKAIQKAPKMFGQ